MPAKRSAKGKAGSTGQPSCHICKKVLSRTSDVRRHMKIHDPSAEKLPCPHKSEGCNYSTHQKSNLTTHVRIHNNDKSCACPDCGFEACDPASVLRHRKNFHGYIPRSGKSKSTHPPIDTSSSSSLTSSINELEFVPHAISPTQVTQPWGEMSPSENGAAPDMDSIFESHWQESQLIHYYNTWLAYID